MKFRVVADSAANLREIKGNVPFVSVPLTIITAERQFVDDSNLDVLSMADFLKAYKGKSGSACPGVQDFVDAFGDAECVYCFTITSNLSGSYNAACVAKNDYETQYPGRRVYMIDSLSAGPEIKIMVEKAVELIEEGISPEEIYDRVMEYKKHTGLLFSLESMQNLANNGRVSHAVAKIAGILGIRAIGCASEVGTLEMLDKKRGEKKAMACMLEHLLKRGYQGGKAVIDHCDNLPAAELLKSMIKEKFENAKVRIEENYGLCSFYAEKGGLIIGFEGK